LHWPPSHSVDLGFSYKRADENLFSIRLANRINVAMGLSPYRAAREKPEAQNGLHLIKHSSKNPLELRNRSDILKKNGIVNSD
jgi:hypothetical protein